MARVFASVGADWHLRVTIEKHLDAVSPSPNVVFTQRVGG
jgi:hypothetical protein